jgi:hypothetical protein
VLLHRFFTEGKLATQASVQPCNDNEYIGAALTFAQHLNQYVLGKACEVRNLSHRFMCPCDELFVCAHCVTV